MVHRSFAQRAWLPQERGCGLAGPAFLTGEDSERVVGVQAPSLAGGKAGLGRGLAGNVSHPELGHGCSQSQGAVQRSGDEREVEDRH